MTQRSPLRACAGPLAALALTALALSACAPPPPPFNATEVKGIDYGRGLGIADTEGRIRRTKVPNSFSGGMREEVLPAPQLGRNTREVLRELGHDEAAIEAMLASGAAFEGLN